MIGNLLPAPRFTGWDDVGVLIPGGLLDTFASGTTTPSPTYTDAVLSVPNTNPIVLDAAGRAVVFLVPGVAYTIRLRTAAGVTVWSQDDVGATGDAASSISVGTAGEALGARKLVYLSDGSGGKTIGRWYLAGRGADVVPASYSSSTPLLGLTTTAIAAGAVGPIATTGTIATLSGLTPGAVYYVNTALGADGGITATAPIPTHTGNGDNELPRVVGLAVSATSLVLLANPPPVRVRVPIIHNYFNNLVGDNIELPVGCDLLIVDQVNAGNVVIQGLSPGFHGQELLIVQATAGRQTLLAHQHGGAAATWRLVLPVTSANMPVLPNGFARVRYDSFIGRWVLFAHDQGDSLTPAFNAADYTASAGNWTLVAGDVTLFRTTLRMRQLEIDMDVRTTEVSAAAPATLNRAIPGGYTAVHQTLQFIRNTSNGGALTVGLVTAAAGLLVFYQTVGAGAWVLSPPAGATGIDGHFFLEVT